MEAHPDKTRLDVPPLKVSLNGMRVLGPTERCSEYQGRVRIYDVDSFEFGPEGAREKVYRFGATFGTADTPHAPHPVRAGTYLLQGVRAQGGT